QPGYYWLIAVESSSGAGRQGAAPSSFPSDSASLMLWLRRIFARDVRVQMIYRLRLGRDNCVYQIANRNHSQEPVSVHDGKVTNARVSGRSSLQDDLAGVVPLGENANQLAAGDDQQRADPLIRHHRDGVIDSRLGTDRPDLAAFVFQNRSDRFRHVI